MDPEAVAASHQPPPLRVWSSRDSTRRARLRRRVVTLPAVLLGFVLFLALLVPALVVGALVDVLGRRRWATVRVALYAVWWAGLESMGVVMAGVLWLRFAPGGRLHGEASFRAHSGLQRWWATNLVRGARRLLGLRFQLDDATPLQRGGPLVVLARHGSQGDALLVAAMLASSGLRPRFILKRQLLWDPCLDLVGHRIPNYFVDRDTVDNREEVRNVGRLGEGLGADEAIVVFPEGTRFSPAKLERAVGILGDTDPGRVPQVRGLRRVLPIRTAGILEILDSAPTPDLVFLNHVGVSDFRSLRDLWRNVPFASPLRFTAERFDRGQVPPNGEQAALVRWLDERWVEFDAWVAANSVQPVGHRLDRRGHRTGVRAL